MGEREQGDGERATVTKTDSAKVAPGKGKWKKEGEKKVKGLKKERKVLQKGGQWLE